MGSLYHPTSFNRQTPPVDTESEALCILVLPLLSKERKKYSILIN
jgi:hypothetical protein